VDADHHPDLFWAIRGAGGNFGIVTAFELDAHPLGKVVNGTMLVDASNAARLLERWGELIERAPRELTGFLYLFARRGGQALARLVSVYASDDTESAISTLTPMLDIASEAAPGWPLPELRDGRPARATARRVPGQDAREAQSAEDAVRPRQRV
jgi:FAD/FMN-containing dehydrogenase